MEPRDNGTVEHLLEAGRELGVRYVLEGTFRQAQGRVRITAQLIETRTGNHVWAQRYDRELDDLLAVQDELADEIVTALDVRLVSGEGARVVRQTLRNREARDLYYRGSALLWLNPPELEKARALFDVMAKAGLKPRVLNIGGGYPVRHVKPIPSIEVIGEVVNEGLRAFPDEVQVIAEPGRYLVSDAGYFVCRVLGTATRAGKRWMHWDAGLFGGVIESSEGLRYRIRTDRSGPDVAWTVAGPTCDSVDVVMREEPLPSDLQEGDFIYIRNAGAYTTAYASQFNGFPLPEVRVFESKV